MVRILPVGVIMRAIYNSGGRYYDTARFRISDDGTATKSISALDVSHFRACVLGYLGVCVIVYSIQNSYVFPGAAATQGQKDGSISPGYNDKLLALADARWDIDRGAVW